MIRASYLEIESKPKEIFVDREEARDLFLANLEEEQRLEQYRIINFFGYGGQGKSALQAHLKKIVDQRARNARLVSGIPTATAYIDLRSSAYRDAIEALLSIRTQIQESTGLDFFPAFDVGYARYCTLIRPGIDITAIRDKRFEKGSSAINDMVGLITSVSGMAVPGFNIISRYGTSLAGKVSKKFYQWWRRRGARLLNGIETLNIDQLLLKMPTLLGSDIYRMLEENSISRFVCQFDTYEALWLDRESASSYANLQADDWIRSFVQETPGSLFVVSGRDRLRWDDIDPEWRIYIVESYLDGIGEKDAEKYLIERGVSHGDIRNKIIGGARLYGEDVTRNYYLPYYVSLQYELYWQKKSRNMAIDPSLFGGSLPQILYRFLDHMDGRSQDVVRALSYLLCPDNVALNQCAKSIFGIQDANSILHDLHHRSFVVQLSEFGFSLSRVLRDSIQEKERNTNSSLYHDMHSFLYKFYADKLRNPNSPTNTFNRQHEALLATRHCAFIDVPGAIEYAVEQFNYLNNLERWQEILDLSTYLAGLFGSTGVIFDKQLYIANGAWMAYALRKLNLFERAVTVYNDIASMLEEQEMSYEINEIVFHNYGEALIDAARFEEAAHIFERLVRRDIKGNIIFEVQYISIIGNLASSLAQSGRNSDAIRIYMEILKRTDVMGLAEKSVRISILNNCANFFSEIGRYEAAAKLYKSMRSEIDGDAEQAGIRHISIDASIGALHREMGNYGESLEILNGVYLIRLERYGDLHPLTVAAMNNTAAVLGDTGRCRESIELFSRVLKCNKILYGADSRYVAITLGNIGCVYRDLGVHELGLQYFEAAAELFNREGDITPHEKSNIYINWARTLLDVGRGEGALEYLRCAAKLVAMEGFDYANIIGRYYIEMGRYQASVQERGNAILNYDKAKEIFESVGCLPSHRWKAEAIRLANDMGKLR